MGTWSNGRERQPGCQRTRPAHSRKLERKHASSGTGHNDINPGLAGWRVGLQSGSCQPKRDASYGGIAIALSARIMAEPITELNYVLSDDQGRQYFPTVVAELIGDRWEAWLEFVPADDSPPLLTNTETHQSTREDVVRWASLLDDVYLQGAFDRAVSATASTVRSPISVVYPAAALDTTGRLFEDPFEMYRQSGKAGLRAHLQPLARTELLLIIDAFKLNPARLSLARLTKSQLVTFIATAVEVQISQGRQ